MDSFIKVTPPQHASSEGTRGISRRIFFQPETEVVWLRVLYLASCKEASRSMSKTAFILPMGSTTLGRSDVCDIMIPEITVSRRHCVFQLDMYGLKVTDLDSLHGVRVNGSLARLHTIRSKTDVSLIQIGQALCAVEVRDINDVPSDTLHEEEAELARGDTHPGARTGLLANQGGIALATTHDTKLDDKLVRDRATTATATRARMRSQQQTTGPMRRVVE